MSEDRPGDAKWHTRTHFIYLASQSPRRRQLLDQIGVRHEPLLPLAGAESDAAEALEAGRPGELPADYVRRVTRAKLRAALARLANRGLQRAPVLCADTTVALGRRSLGKPHDAADAAAMLALLSGRTHRVITAVAVAAAPMSGGAGAAARPRVRLLVNTSHVRFAAIASKAIDAYVAGGEPFGKAGAYAIQGAAAAWIERIDGSHSGIMGLPLFETSRLLRWAAATVERGRPAASHD